MEPAAQGQERVSQAPGRLQHRRQTVRGAARSAGVRTVSTPPPTSAGTIWFSRTHGKVDLQALDNEIKAAKAGILFLMFQPGSNGVLPTVEQAAQNPDLYVRGVVSELPSDDQHPADDQQHADVAVVRDDQTQHLTTPIIEPEGIAHPVSNWALGELTHADVRSHIGFAIVHSKTLVIDPFGDHPVVITGSHNFSEPASTKNDENFLIVKDDPPLAEAYAVHIMAAYDHYRYRAAQIENKGLARTDDWMAPKLAESTEELRVWGVRP